MSAYTPLDKRIPMALQTIHAKKSANPCIRICHGGPVFCGVIAFCATRQIAPSRHDVTYGGCPLSRPAEREMAVVGVRVKCKSCFIFDSFLCKCNKRLRHKTPVKMSARDSCSAPQQSATKSRQSHQPRPASL